jgi:hypothetical protein
MKICPPRRILLALFVASAALNVWQFFHPQPLSAAGDTGTRHRASTIAKNDSDPMPLGGKKHDTGSGDEPGRKAAGMKRDAAELPPDQRSEDALIFGRSGHGEGTPIHGEPSGKVSPQRLVELAGTAASQAERFQLHARLLLPGDRELEFETLDFAAGQRIKLERLREFPFPGSIVMARADGPVRAGQPAPPVTPTTPGNFEFKNLGLEIELDVTPAPGSLVIGGNIRQTVFEGFALMPGEAFSPVWEDSVILTENKVLQPQFISTENPFVAAATAGQPLKVPVLMSFGQTVLELTCSPLE